MTETHLAQFNLKINGQQAPEELMSALVEITVENSLALPGICAIRINDPEFKWVDDDRFTEGKSIEIQAGHDRDPLVTIFNGEITGLEFDLAGFQSSNFIVRCMDRMHRLHRGRHSRSFVNVTDSDIVSRLASESGLQANVDSTTVTHDWVFQNNQTNWEFLRDRAARCGHRLYVDGQNRLCFKKINESAIRTVEAEWGKTLRSFRPRTAASSQVDEVVVRAWNPQTKEPIVGVAKAAQGLPDTGLKSGSEVSKTAFGSAKIYVVDRPMNSQDEAQKLAQSVFDTIGGSYLEAEGLCYGNTSLMPGARVDVKNVGRRLSGTYFVTATVHLYSPDEGYSTQFMVSGKQPTGLLTMMGETKETARQPLGGNILIGIVVDNNDPDKKGRIKVKYPCLTEDHTSHWARIASQMAGKERGMFNLPEIDDEVLVAFEHGDIHRPIIIGMLWNGKDTFPTVEGNAMVAGGKVERRGFYTRIGHQFIFDDTSGKGEIRIKSSNGHLFVIDDANKKIQVKTTSGHSVTLDDQGNTITVVDKTGSNKITIASNSNAISMECNGNFSVNAKGQVSIEGQAGISVKTPAMMTLEASGMATVKSSGIMTIQGSLVKIN